MATIESGLVSDFDHEFAAAFGRLYRVNGWNRMSVWDGFQPSVSAAVAAGIAAPPTWTTTITSSLVDSLATSGWVGIGPHLLRYRYMNSRTQYVSDPTPNLLTLNAKYRDDSAAITGAIYTLSGIVKSADPKVDRILIEQTDAGGGVFFVATTLANSAWHSVALQTDDDDLRGAPLFWDEFGHDPPPYFSLVEGFRGRLWGLGQNIYSAGAAQIAGATVAVSGSGTTWTSAAKGRFLQLSGDARRFIESVVSTTELKLESAGASASLRNYKIISETPDVLYFSKPLFPESWPTANRIRVLDGRPEKAKAMKGWRRDLVIFGERSMERLIFDEDPFQDGAREPIEGERGAVNQRCVQDIGAHLYSLDYKGLHRFSGTSPTHISEVIDILFDQGDRSEGYVDFAYSKTFHSVHYPQRHQILWFVTINGTPGDSTTYTIPHHAISYDYLGEKLAIYKFDKGIVASTISPASDGTSQTLLADAFGNTYVFGINATDCVHTSSPLSIAVKSGTTASNVLVSGSALYATGDGLVGAIAYWVDGDQTGYINANSASGMTISGGFSSAPSSGDTLYLGRIPMKWKSKDFYFGKPSFRHQDGRYLHLYYKPQSLGLVRVRFYLDRSSTAYDKYDADFSSGGISLDADNNYFEVDLTTASGYARIPLPTDGSHTIAFELEIVHPGVKFDMTGFEIDGYAEEEDVDE